MTNEMGAGRLPEWLEPHAGDADGLRTACAAVLGMMYAFVARSGSSPDLDLGQLFTVALHAIEVGPTGQAGPDAAMEAVLRELSGPPAETVIPDLDPDSGP
ncbi:MAG: hypothetical protein ABR564_08545 [Candidatus Dormibacteria bacterium]